MLDLRGVGSVYMELNMGGQRGGANVGEALEGTPSNLNGERA